MQKQDIVVVTDIGQFPAVGFSFFDDFGEGSASVRVLQDSNSWTRELLRIVKSRVHEDTSDYALRILTSKIAETLEMEQAPSPDALRFRTKAKD